MSGSVLVPEEHMCYNFETILVEDVMVVADLLVADRMDNGMQVVQRQIRQPQQFLILRSSNVVNLRLPKVSYPKLQSVDRSMGEVLVVELTPDTRTALELSKHVN